MKALYIIFTIILHIQIYCQIPDDLFDFDIADDSTFFAVGTEGIIAKTIDRGETWDFQQSGISSYIRYVDFINVHLGWIRTNYSVFKTTDSGNSWINLANLPFLGGGELFMVDEMNGWIDGDEYNELLKTTDGGISWEILNPFGSYRDVGNIFFFDSLTGWITVYSEVPYHLTPSISHTSNGGVDWVTQYSGQRDTRINGVFFISHTRGWAVSNSGLLLKTTNGGITWEQYYLQTNQDLAQVFFIDEQKGWISSGQPSYPDSILVTTDGGITWNRAGFGVNITSFKFIDELNGFALARWSLLASTDGGYTWTNNIILSNQETENSSVINQFSLSQNYPNPFNPATSLLYTVGSRQFVTIKVYDLLGREIATLINEEKSAGEYEVEFNAVNLPSGIYFYRIKAGSFIKTKKMVLLR